MINEKKDWHRLFLYVDKNNDLKKKEKCMDEHKHWMFW